MVLLKNCGGSSGKSISRPFDNKTCDYVFILTGDNKTYLIPAKEIKAKNAIAVGNKYTEYEVFSKSFNEFAKNNS